MDLKRAIILVSDDSLDLETKLIQDLPSPTKVLQDEIHEGYSDMMNIFNLKSKLVDPLIKGAEEFNFINSFSLIRVFPRLCSQRSFLQEVMSENPLDKLDKR